MASVLRAKTLEPGTEYQALREAWWNQMLNAETVYHPQRSTLFNIFQQNRTDVEAACSGLYDERFALDS